MNTEIQDGIIILEVELTQIDASVAVQFQQLLNQAIEKAINDHPEKKILLDLGKVTFIDSSGLGKILGGLRMVNQAGGKMAVTAQNSAVATLFKIVRLNQLTTIYADRRSALDELAH